MINPILPQKLKLNSYDLKTKIINYDCDVFISDKGLDMSYF